MNFQFSNSPFYTIAGEVKYADTKTKVIFHISLSVFFILLSSLKSLW